MVALLSLTNLLLGLGLASRAPRDPKRAATIETLAGVALITGLALIGLGLRSIPAIGIAPV